jgi:hypothetical protein
MNISNNTSIQLDYASVSYLPTYSSLTNATILSMMAAQTEYIVMQQIQ